jgi:pimeloyl-ACP methyl ester carboxylesterase/CRP-like cAMP-binding protein
MMGLLSQRFQCMAVDLPGYGQSPPFEGRATIVAYADLLAEFIAQVSDGPVVLVGHSMGGMISITLALRHPVLVERMVLISPTITGRLSNLINFGVSPITLMERFGLGGLIVSSVEKTFVGLTDRIMRPVSFAERTGITKEDYKRILADVRHPGQGRVRAECFFAMRDNNLSGRLKDVETPTLVLWGAEDNTVPLRDAGVVADEWADADLRILPKAGHWPQFEAPDIMRRIVAAYLGLPLTSDKLHSPVEDDELMQIREIAQFLAHSDVGNGLNLAHRTRLAAQCEPRFFRQGENIIEEEESGHELYIILSGEAEVWKEVEDKNNGASGPQKVTVLRAGQVTGELGLLEQGLRSADVIAGPGGVKILALERERLLALCEDDAILGTRLLFNISKTLAQRVRFVYWQLYRDRRLAVQQVE